MITGWTLDGELEETAPRYPLLPFKTNSPAAPGAQLHWDTGTWLPEAKDATAGSHALCKLPVKSRGIVNSLACGLLIPFLKWRSTSQPDISPAPPSPAACCTLGKWFPLVPRGNLSQGMEADTSQPPLNTSLPPLTVRQAGLTIRPTATSKSESIVLLG